VDSSKTDRIKLPKQVTYPDFFTQQTINRSVTAARSPHTQMGTPFGTLWAKLHPAQNQGVEEAERKEGRLGPWNSAGSSIPKNQGSQGSAG